MTIFKELELQKEVQDNIIDEYNKLKKSEASIIGDVVAVMKKSDSFLGKPENLVNHDNDVIYVVFKPTKLAKVSGMNIDVICNKKSEIKFIPVETLFFRLFEFNFLYTQMIENEQGLMVATEEFKVLIGKYKLMSDGKLNKHLKFKKESTIAYCVWQDIISGKFKRDYQIMDRLYLVVYLLGRLEPNYADKYIGLFDEYLKFGMTDNIIDTINKVNGHNLNKIDSFYIKESGDELKLITYKQVYKLLTGEEA